MAKLGYTFYPKDWRSSYKVSGLSLQEKGFYRELIDECYINNTKTIQLNAQTFCRLHGINRRSFDKLLQNLSETSLIVIEDLSKTIITIDSVSVRLGVISVASKGGKAKKEAHTLSSAKEKEKDNNKEKDKIKDKVNIEALPLLPEKDILSDYKFCVDFWLKEFHVGWSFGGQQGKALKSILKKIKSLKSTDSDFNVFKLICLKLPEWYKEKDLSIIDSKFNEIIEEIKTTANGKSTNNSKSNSTIVAINSILADHGLL